MGLADFKDDITIEKYVSCTIGMHRMLPDGTHDHLGVRCVLKTYDLPRDLFFRKQWVIRWRQSQLQCLYPKCNVQTSIGFYDKKTGLGVGAGSAYWKLRSAKGMVTKVANALAEYEAEQNKLLIWESDRDEIYQKGLAKLARYEKELVECQAEYDRQLAIKQNAKSKLQNQ